MLRKLLFLKTAKMHKTRLLLSCLSIMLVVLIASFTLNVLYSVTAFQRKLLSCEERKVFVVDNPTEIYRYPWEVGHTRPAFRPEMIDFFRQDAAIDSVLPIYFDSQAHRYTFYMATQYQLQGDVKFHMVTPDYFDFFQIQQVAGSTDIPLQPGDLLINQALQQALYPNGEAIGQTLQLAGSDFPVRGVVDDYNKGLNIRIQPQVIMQAYIIIQPAAIAAEKIMFKFGKDVEEPAIEVERLLAEFHSSFTNLTGVTLEPYLAAFNELIQQYQEGSWVFTVVSLLLFLAVEVGIFGIYYLSNIWKTRDFCIRILYGNRGKDLFIDILCEYACISLAGSVGGILLSSALIGAMNHYIHPPIRLTTDLMTDIALLIATNLISLILGLYPAYKAIQLKPVDLLNEQLR